MRIKRILSIHDVYLLKEAIYVIVAITLSSIAIGVGRQLISTVVRQGKLVLKYSA